MEKTKLLIKNTLNELGASPEIKGYRYLVDAILMVIEDEDVLHRGIVKGLYCEVAEKYKGENGIRVERAIRHAVERIFDRYGGDLLEQLFRNNISPNKGKATNSQFIAVVAEHVKTVYGV